MTKPEIKAVTISSNPALAKQRLTVSIEVTEDEIVFKSMYYYAGTEIIAGEEVGLI